MSPVPFAHVDDAERGVPRVHDQDARPHGLHHDVHRPVAHRDRRDQGLGTFTTRSQDYARPGTPFQGEFPRQRPRPADGAPVSHSRRPAAAPSPPTELFVRDPIVAEAFGALAIALYLDFKPCCDRYFGAVA